ncbi:unnamed protein product, partial [Phaeothamnion confervicola]
MELAHRFVGRGHEVCVMGRGKDGARQYVDSSGVQIMEYSGFNRTGRIVFDLFKDFLCALRVIPQIPRSDIVVTNSFSLPVVLMPFKRLKGKIVVHVQRYPKGQMWLYLGADAIQTVSGVVARAIERQCRALKGRVSIIGNPINTALYCPPAEGRRTAASPVVLYVGRIHPEKGLHLLIEAFRSVADRVPMARLRIVGPVSESSGGGGEEYSRSLRAAAAGLKIEFVNAISEETALSRVYREADCFCYP